MREHDEVPETTPPQPQITVEYPRDEPEMPWQGTVERLGWGGQGVARLDDGRILLLSAPLALFPGEEVTAAVRMKARHGEGQVLAWTKPDPRRAAPDCPHAASCGGCDMWGAGAGAGAGAGELKRQMVADLLHRSLPGAVEWEWLPAPDTARRSRIQLHWDGARLGFTERASNTIVDIERCPLAEPLLSRAIALLRTALASGKLPDGPMRWELALAGPAGEIVAVQAPPGTALANPVWMVWAAGDDGARVLRQGRGNPPRIEQQLPQGVLRHAAGGFFQGCPQWAAQAFGQVYREWRLGGSTLFDVFGGVGFHSLLLAQEFSRLVVVEADSLAAHYAGLNLTGKCHSVVNATAEGWLNRPEVRQAVGDQDVLLLDPPRAGLSTKAAAALCGLDAAALVLCGCDGASFCRDVRRLAPSWNITRLAVLDIFPNTVQVECVGLLTRP